ncbi:MAG TPA: acyltransferase [Pseudomonas sp.]|uniref:acyltransferase family protein n=1 Tax=Pseudomonas sp. TaxID=306 RepID=UPI002CD56BCF|nr:acyltransferase [Pseudomonas sp.]HWH87752.1 acyltransferase [Pseudomonas sp.]
MGAYRLLLAVVVAVSHMGKTFMGLNPGVVAVISFLIISGFVMTSLIERNYKAPGKIGLFYADRVLRLYPQFLFYFFASCAVIHFLLPGTPQAAELTSSNIAASLAMVPLGFYMFGATGAGILPPAWSLGLEMCFYLVIPFLVIFKARGVSFVLSVAVFIPACLGFINTDLYGYRLLPGVLFIFLCGSYLFRPQPKGLMIAAGTTVVAALVFLAIMAGLIERKPSNAEVALGIALGIPAVYMLTRLKFHKADEFLGNISYGVFLNHFVVIYFLHGLRPIATFDVRTVATVLLLSLLLSVGSYYFVERPALKLRHALRSGGKATLDQMTPSKAATSG